MNFGENPCCGQGVMAFQVTEDTLQLQSTSRLESRGMHHKKKLLADCQWTLQAFTTKSCQSICSLLHDYMISKKPSFTGNPFTEQENSVSTSSQNFHLHGPIWHSETIPVPRHLKHRRAVPPSQFMSFCRVGKDLARSESIGPATVCGLYLKEPGHPAYPPCVRVMYVVCSRRYTID